MVDKGLTYTGILIMILIMGAMWAGFSDIFSNMNENPNYAVNVNNSALKLFNYTKNVSSTANTVKSQINESSSRWTDTLGLIWEGSINFVNTLSNAFKIFTKIGGSLGSFIGLPNWFVVSLGVIISVITIGLLLRTILNRGTI